MSSFLAHLHADLRHAHLTGRRATHHPKDVPTGLHKEYPRMEQIELPQPVRFDYSLQDALAQRRSASNTEVGLPIQLAEFGTLFGSALRRHAKGKRRMYPSGGALYPVETYLIATQTDGMAPGIFHYNPTTHSLERLWALPREFAMEHVMRISDSLKPSALIVFTGAWERSSAKYGDLSYIHTLLEAGHMSENILLTATALGLETRPYAGFSDEVIAQLLDLDEESEQAILSITLSKPSPSQSTLAKPAPADT